MSIEDNKKEDKKFIVEAEVWSMNDGVIEKIRVRDTIYSIVKRQGVSQVHLEPKNIKEIAKNVEKRKYKRRIKLHQRKSKFGEIIYTDGKSRQIHKPVWETITATFGDGRVYAYSELLACLRGFHTTVGEVTIENYAKKYLWYAEKKNFEVEKYYVEDMLMFFMKPKLVHVKNGKHDAIPKYHLGMRKPVRQ